MDNKTELEQIKSDFISERNASWFDQMNANPGLYLCTTQLTETYFFQKLAEMELRLRRLEKSNSKTQSFIGRNTPLI